MKKLIILLFICVLFLPALSQSEKKVTVSAGLDVLSTWIWRGQKMHNGPSIQPYINLTAFENLNIGAVGVIGLPNDNYNEIDLYASYKLSYFTLKFTDYYIYPVSEKYFDYKPETTGHYLEGGLVFTNKFMALSGYVFFYGADHDTAMNEYYSSYFEACYFINNTMNVFVGSTLGKGFYKQGDLTKEINFDQEGFAIVNIGISKIFKIKKIPFETSLIVNPEANRVWINVKISLFEI